MILHLTTSLDGFVAGPGRSTDGMTTATTRPCSDARQRAILVLTPHPADALRSAA